jgi:osmotically-inducible protein OsmY
VPGVRNVISRLYTDTDLAAAVSQALAADPLTQAIYHIKVTSYRGQVMLVGKATGTDGAHAASQVASGVPGVRAVVNRLTLSETMH